MALSAVNFVVKGPIKSVDMKQFVDLFTGVMVDQPVTFKNAMVLGGSQGSTTAPLSLYGAVSQTSNLINLYPTTASLTPTFGFAAYGQFSWGAGGTAVQDTFLSRIALQNGHVTDTAGLLIDPVLEVKGGVTATGYNFPNGTAISSDNPLSLVVNRDLTLNRRLILPLAGAVTNPSIQLANTGFISSRDHLNNIVPVFVTTTDDFNAFYLGPAGLAFTNSANTTRVATIGTTGDGAFRYLTVSDGSNGVISSRNGNLYLRAAGGATSVVMDTGSGGLLLTSGPLNVTSSYIAAGPAISGSAGDLNANRGNNTGYVFLGNAGHHIGFDGTNYVLPTSGLVMAGGLTVQSASGITSGGSVSIPQGYTISSGGAMLWYDGASTVIQAHASGTRWVNDANSVNLMTLDNSGNLSPIGDVRLPAPRVLNLGPVSGGAVVSPGTNLGKSADTVYLSAHAYVFYDLGVGHIVTCQSLVQTSDPNLKSVSTVFSDSNCMVRIRGTLPVYTYQLAPPTPTPPGPPQPTPTVNDIGFMAPDVYANSPEFASLDAQGVAVGVNYPNMVALLWGALRDLDKRCVAFGI